MKKNLAKDLKILSTLIISSAGLFFIANNLINTYDFVVAVILVGGSLSTLIYLVKILIDIILLKK